MKSFLALAVIFSIVVAPMQAFASCPFANSNNAQLRKICDATVAQKCSDIPIEKRKTCQPNPLSDVGNFFLGCGKGVFNSAIGYLKFVWDVGKTVLTYAVKGIVAGGKYVVATAKGEKMGLSQAHAAGISQLKNYIAREYEIAKRKHGIFAVPALVGKIAAPIMKTIGNEIVDFLGGVVHNLQCYNTRATMEMVCRAAADLLIPPAGVIAILKGLDKKAVLELPNIQRAISKIEKNMATDAVVAARETKSAKATVTSVQVGRATKDMGSIRRAQIINRARFESKTIKRAEPVTAHSSYKPGLPQSRAADVDALREKGYSISNAGQYVASGEKIEVLGSEKGNEFDRLVYRIKQNDKQKGTVTKIYFVKGQKDFGLAKPYRSVNEKTGEVTTGYLIELSLDRAVKDRKGTIGTLLHETKHSSIPNAQELDRSISFYSPDRKLPSKDYPESIRADEIEARLGQITKAELLEHPRAEGESRFRGSDKLQSETAKNLKAEVLDMTNAQEKMLSAVAAKDLILAQPEKLSVEERELRQMKSNLELVKVPAQVDGHTIELEFYIDKTKPQSVMDQINKQIEKRKSYLEQVRNRLSDK